MSTLRILDVNFSPHRTAFVISITAVGEESSSIRAIAKCAVGGALRFISQATPLLELHVNAAARGIDSNPALRGGNADYHTGLI